MALWPKLLTSWRADRPRVRARARGAAPPPRGDLGRPGQCERVAACLGALPQASSRGSGLADAAPVSAGERRPPAAGRWTVVPTAAVTDTPWPAPAAAAQARRVRGPCAPVGGGGPGLGGPLQEQETTKSQNITSRAYETGGGHVAARGPGAGAPAWTRPDPTDATDVGGAPSATMSPPRPEESLVPTYTAQLTTPASADQAFAYLAQFDNTQHWDPGVSAARPLSDGPPALGSRWCKRPFIQCCPIPAASYMAHRIRAKGNSRSGPWCGRIGWARPNA